MNIRHFLRSMNIRARLSNLDDERWDRRLGISTFGHFDPTVDDGRYYGTAKYSVLRKVFEVLACKPKDVLFDVGCGLGRPMFYACAEQGVERCVGIEANEKLVRLGRENIRRYRGGGTVSIEQALAQEVNYDEADIVFMYNPFGFDTMEAVLAQLQVSLIRRPRVLRVAYLNPIEERVFLSSSSFEKTAELTHVQLPKLNTGAYKPKEIPAVSFFTSR